MIFIAMTCLLSWSARSLPTTSCASRLGPRDLQLEALSKIVEIPEFESPIWEWALQARGSAPYIMVVGPDSARKSAAIQKLVARVREAKVYDVPTHSAAAIQAGKLEWYASAWLAEVHLHVLSLGLPRDFAMHEWQDFDHATAALGRFGFDHEEMMGLSGIYLITP